jgi:hypothetical protein
LSGGGFCAAGCGLRFVRHFCLWQAVLYICWNYLFLITLQEQIDTVKIEGVDNVRGEDCTKIKIEDDYMELAGRVKCELEVSVLCCLFYGSDLCTGVCVCVC